MWNWFKSRRKLIREVEAQAKCIATLEAKVKAQENEIAFLIAYKLVQGMPLGSFFSHAASGLAGYFLGRVGR